MSFPREVYSGHDNSSLQDLEQLAAEQADSVSSHDSFDIPVFGEEDSHSWDPPPKAFGWYKKVSDIELSKDQINEMLADFIPSPEVMEHFTPPQTSFSSLEKTVL